MDTSSGILSTLNNINCYEKETDMIRHLIISKAHLKVNCCDLARMSERERERERERGERPNIVDYICSKLGTIDSFLKVLNVKW
jgi:hypothetical protein